MNISDKRRTNRRRGAALIETALVLTATVSMIVFIVDMGRVLLTEQFITERARAAVRSAVVNNWSSDQVANYVAYGTTTAPAGNPPGFLGITPSEVSFNAYADSGIGDGRYQVTVQGVKLLTFIPYIAGTYNAPAVVATAPIQSQGSTN